MPKLLHAYGIILRPLITEKAQVAKLRQNRPSQRPKKQPRKAKRRA